MKQEEKNEEVTLGSATKNSKFQKGSFHPSSRRLNKNVPSGQLDKKGPSVFSGSEPSEISRTGRKIQTTFTVKELRTEVPASSRFASRRSDDVNLKVATDGLKVRSGYKSSQTISGSEKTPRKNVDLSKKDSLPIGSENISVDIPVVFEVTKRSVSTKTNSPEEPQKLTEIQRRTETDSRRNYDRGTRTRGRTSSTESSRSETETVSQGRGNFRRGSSRQTDQAKVTEAPEPNKRSGNRFSKDEVDTIRSRNSEIKSRVGDVSEPRSRGRRPNVANQESVSQGSNTQGPNSQSETSRKSGVVRGTRVSDSRSRTPESRTQDVDPRRKLRIRSRVESTTTTKSIDLVTLSPELMTNVPETAFETDGPATSTESENEATTIYLLPSGTTPTIMTSRSTTTVASVNRIVSTTTSRTTRRESEGTTRTNERTGAQRRKASPEDFFNHGLGFRGRRPPTNTTTTADPKVVASITTAAPVHQSKGIPGWTLNRRPYIYSAAESSPVTMVEANTTTSGVTTKSPGRRGNKNFSKLNENSGLIANSESLESQNYPPDFKAKLAQLVSLFSCGFNRIYD